MLNVRLKFCTIPPRLKSLLKLPTDRHLLQQLEQCIRKLLSSEKEPDVCTAVREVSQVNIVQSILAFEQASRAQGGGLEVAHRLNPFRCPCTFEVPHLKCCYIPSVLCNLPLHCRKIAQLCKITCIGQHSCFICCRS